MSPLFRFFSLKKCSFTAARFGYRLASVVAVIVLLFPSPALAQRTRAAALPLPVVAIHVSELTLALESMPASLGTPQPPSTPDASGYQWWYTSWHYFVFYESLMEALRSDGTPFVTVSDADIRRGGLLQRDGSVKYPILFSLASEAVSSEEVQPLRDYVAAGGFLFVGSSSFTRFPDGSSRGDFALAKEIGLHMALPSLKNWYANQRFTKAIDHRLVAHIPWGKLKWNMPLTAEQVPWGTSYYGHPLHGAHYAFQVQAADATVIASGSRYPLLAARSYGRGTFIYHADLQPLLGFGGADSGMYAYGIYRSAIQWAFEAAGLPLIRLSPWRYSYDAAFIIRHDLENSAGQGIESSAKAEFEAGAKGDYYFCTGVLRDQLKNSPDIVASLRRAVSQYGATIGPHNGGLKNPNDVSLGYKNLDYWHWGPDEAIHGASGGYDYALQSVSLAYQDIDRWLADTDNGRPGCGAAGSCPHTWASPYFNSTSEESSQILAQVNALSVGEQKLGPFPHFTLSTRTAGLLYPQVSLPVSDWYVGDAVAQSIESGHDPATIRALVDFYYQMGALVNLYGHSSSAKGLMNVYMKAALAKPRMWAANAVSIADWWNARSGASISPSYIQTGSYAVVSVLLSGAKDPETAIDIALSSPSYGLQRGLQVLLDGQRAGSDRYRLTENGLKIKVGGIRKVEIRFQLALGSQ